MKRFWIGFVCLLVILAMTTIPTRADDKVIVNLGVIKGTGDLIRVEQNTMFMLGMGYRVDVEEFLGEMPFSFIEFNINLLPFRYKTETYGKKTEFAVDFEGKFGWTLGERFYISTGAGFFSSQPLSDTPVTFYTNSELKNEFKSSRDFYQKTVLLINFGWKFRTVYASGAGDPFGVTTIERGIDWGFEVGIKGKKAIHLSLLFYF